MTSLQQGDIKILEQSRQRLFQLTKSLEALQISIQKSDPLPPWTSLQSHATIISQTLLTVSQHLTKHEDLLSSTVAYPLPNFPSRNEESLLGQLLRKKLEPNVEDWVQRGRDIATNGDDNDDEKDSAAVRTVLREDELSHLWEWAGAAANAEARKREWGDVFTLEERESGVKKVVTGLRRRLDDDDDDDEDDDEDDDNSDDDDENDAGDKVDNGEAKDVTMTDDTGGEIVGVRRKPGQTGIELKILQQDDASSSKVPQSGKQPVPVDDVLRFMTVGAEPSEGGLSRSGLASSPRGTIRR